MHISTGLLAQSHGHFWLLPVWVLYAEVVRIVFTNLRTMSESRKTFRFVDLVAMKQSQHVYIYIFIFNIYIYIFNIYI